MDLEKEIALAIKKGNVYYYEIESGKYDFFLALAKGKIVKINAILKEILGESDISMQSIPLQSLESFFNELNKRLNKNRAYFSNQREL